MMQHQRVGRVTVVCALHSNSERGALGAFKTRLEAEATILVETSKVDRDPFTFVGGGRG